MTFTFAALRIARVFDNARDVSRHWEEILKPQDKHNKAIKGWIRPLSMPSIRILSFENPVEKIEPAMLLCDLCRDRPTDALETIKKRYLKLSTQDLDIFIVPAESPILEKIVWPLKSAKQAFCLADFIGCIALCGMVCEMAIIFIYDLAVSLWDISRLDHKCQKIFVARKYERLGQEQRIKELRKLGAITDLLTEDANTVRRIRREYLHFLSKGYANIEEDAYKAYTAAFRVIRSLVALPLGEQGKLAIPAHLRSYLELKGVSSPNRD